MSAAEALRLARENGIRIGLSGADLVLEAEREPASRVLATIRRHKASIVRLLTAAEGDWTAEDWQAFIDERAGIAEFDGGQTRTEAEAVAFECCIAEWLDQNPEPSEPGKCAWCGQSETVSSVVVPLGTRAHTWLHPECWSGWSQDRRERAREALAAAELDAPSRCVTGANLQDDFEKIGGA